jgi:hypothetical protein
MLSIEDVIAQQIYHIIMVRNVSHAQPVKHLMLQLKHVHDLSS